MSMTMLRSTSQPKGGTELLSEEDKAALNELNLRLHEGLSDSDDGSFSEPKEMVQEVKKKQFIGPPRPKNRDGMGAYVPPAGGKPLSRCYIPNPGPPDYDVKDDMTYKTFPQYSLGEKPSERRRKKGNPAPNKYYTGTDIKWGKCRHFKIKDKFPEPRLVKAPGPNTYVHETSIGKGPKFSLRIRPDDNGLMPGLISSLAPIPNLQTPGPNYCPSSCEWLQKPQTFRSKHKLPKPPKGPGPQAHPPMDKPGGPKWSIGKRLRAKRPPRCPGPAAHDIKTTIGDAPKAPFSNRIPQLKPNFPNPGPAAYNRAGFSLAEPGYTMKYRWFDPRPEVRPGPNKYKGEKAPVVKRNPAYTFSHKTQPTYPSNVYGGLCNRDDPGPSDYVLPELPNPPGKTFGMRYRACPARAPGPACYDPSTANNVIQPRAPVFSLGNKIYQKPDYDAYLSPHSYQIKPTDSKPGKSFGLKLHTRRTSYGPGPAYLVQNPPWDTGKGATLRSRHTPCMYLGLAQNSKMPPTPKDFPTAPLLG